MEEDWWVAICQALHEVIETVNWREMHDKLKEVWRCIGVKKAGERVADLDTLTWTRIEGQNFIF